MDTYVIESSNPTYGNENNTQISFQHIRHRRAANDTTSGGGFMDNPDNVAMFVVLPLIVFVYGGCMCIYCIHRCQEYMERERPVRKVKRKILRTFGRPVTPTPEPSDDEEDHLEVTQVHRSPDLPEGKGRNTASAQSESIHEDADDTDLRSGHAYSASSHPSYSASDGDSGINDRSDGDQEFLLIRETKNTSYCDNPSYDRQMKTCAVQTEDVIIMEKKRRPSRPPSKPTKVAPRYLGWLNSESQVQGVVESNEHPLSMPLYLRGAQRKSENSQNNTLTSYKSLTKRDSKQSFHNIGSRSSDDSLSPIDLDHTNISYKDTKARIDARINVDVAFSYAKSYKQIYTFRRNLKEKRESDEFRMSMNIDEGGGPAESRV